MTAFPGSQGSASSSFSSTAMAAIMAMISMTSAPSSSKRSLSKPFTNWMTPRFWVALLNGTHTIEPTDMPLKSMAVSTSCIGSKPNRRSAFCDS